MINAVFAALLATTVNGDVPTITIDRDNVRITESCRVEITQQPIIDEDGDGVIHIVGDGISIDFAGQRLHGAEADQLPDSYSGIGIKITGKNVTLVGGANVSGFKVGIYALEADGLTLSECDVSDNYRQRLKSTPKAEDGSDWLWPHNNDQREWMTNYGAGVCVERSDKVTIRNIRARHVQNGIILDRVNDSKVYDCDCSFLSGWGLAMWRSNRNLISRNAFDFCVRGYSHGVYNRGQDSAGILMFEQCSENTFVENSATHCGDGFFGFAGKEALGEVNPKDDTGWYKRRGCNDNVIAENDFSFAVAHGIELTFSFGNRITANRLVGNGICGIWGGYSQETGISVNAISSNGDAGYGLERGGINIEHGRDNLIFQNHFGSNPCGVHLWWDDDAALFATPWGRANLHDDKPAAIIRENTFESADLAMHLRHMRRPVLLALNKFQNIKQDLNIEGDRTVTDDTESFRLIERAVPGEDQRFGQNSPRAARHALRGREHIIMTQWGPWDRRSPLLQFVEHFDGADRYRVLGVEGALDASSIRVEGDVRIDVVDQFIEVRAGARDTLIPYSISLARAGETITASGVHTGGSWTAKTFASACDPREDVERWRREGLANAHALSAHALDFRFGSGGMTEARGLPVPLPHDHFGVIATRSLTFPAGKWRIKATSDDGVRVWMNEKVVIDDWTWHPPTEHVHEFTITEPTTFSMRVEYFELDGYAVLSLDIETINDGS